MKVLLLASGLVVTGLWYFGSQAPPPVHQEPPDQGLSPSALAKIARMQADREAKAAMKAKIDPVIARIEDEGITRGDLITYFEREVLDDIDIDGVCKDRDNLP